MSKLKTHSTTKDMHHQDIMAAIRKKGTSLAELARHHGYKNPRTLNSVFRAPYPKAERIIAEFLGVKPEEIWPTRYQDKRGFKSITEINDTQRNVA